MTAVDDAAVVEVGREAPGWQPPSSLYLHVPFCPYKCAYCDFVTHVGSPSLVAPYVEALCHEIERISPGDGPLQTVYLGGGTPTMLSPAQIDQILSTVDRSFGLAVDTEISLEANPDTVNREDLAQMRAAGMNRLSIGVQTLDVAELGALGRGHTPEEAISSFREARDAGLENVSLDLIYGAPGQSIDSWERTLTRAVGLGPDHISLYSLIVEPATRFWRQQEQGRLTLPPDDDVVDMYQLSCRLLQDAGYEHYEVANWARPGRQARHNCIYWLDEQFFAAGVGAYDYLRPYRSRRVRSTKSYIERMRAGQSVIVERELVAPADEQFETAAMRLRLLKHGLEGRVFVERFGRTLEPVYGTVIEDLVDLGFLERKGDVVYLREHMVPLANEAWQRFLPPT